MEETSTSDVREMMLAYCHAGLSSVHAAATGARCVSSARGARQRGSGLPSSGMHPAMGCATQPRPRMPTPRPPAGVLCGRGGGHYQGGSRRRAGPAGLLRAAGVRVCAGGCLCALLGGDLNLPGAAPKTQSAACGILHAHAPPRRAPAGDSARALPRGQRMPLHADRMRRHTLHAPRSCRLRAGRPRSWKTARACWRVSASRSNTQ